MITPLIESLKTWLITAPAELSSWSIMIVGFVLVGQMLRLARSSLA